jgi:ribosomal protein S18 acetylase RimI-like enzyme
MGAISGMMWNMVQPLERSDRDEAAEVLARAFRDNPGIIAALKGDSPETRLRLLGPCMEGFVESTLRYGVGEVVKDANRIVAVSLAFAPDRFPPPFHATVVQARGPIRAGLRRALRFARIDQEMRKRHPHHYRHWYLWFLGAEPQRQGQGFGSKLLRSLSAKAEADGVACYLETDKATNVKIYEHHGYVLESEEVLVPGTLDLKMWFMKRPSARA